MKGKGKEGMNEEGMKETQKVMKKGEKKEVYKEGGKGKMKERGKK
jgi:hypothetical protein